MTHMLIRNLTFTFFFPTTQPDPPCHVINALLTTLSCVFQKVPPSTVVKKRSFLLELLVRVFGSPSLNSSRAQLFDLAVLLLPGLTGLRMMKV
ncbi:hypothetical protein ACFX2F_026884 [Malus domestica]